MFCHLHNHTEFSLLDGMSTSTELAKRAKEIGQTAIALTDHGYLFGVIDFYNACKEEGIKPIIGCEVYITENSNIKEKKELASHGYSSYHLILLAKNKTGYKNLIKLVTRANLEGFYKKPRIDRKMLNKGNVNGIVCLSACMQGEIGQAILTNNMEKADELCTYYKNLFGADFYLEVQANRLPEQAIINEQIYALSEKHGIKVVATTDSHYPTAEDYRFHDVILAIGTKKALSDPERMMFTCNDFYVKTEEEMLEMLGRQDVLDNTMEVANKCNLELSFDDKFFPSFEVPEGYTPNAFFDKLCFDGLYGYLTKNKDLDKDVYLERLRYELDIIDNKGYAEYFLIVNDFIRYCRSNNISVGPGRGSAAGSLATFVLGITKLDPIKHDLVFERFLNPERIELPDIDIDFCYDNRSRVVDYVIEKYGQDKVANVATFGTLAARAALDGTGMALGILFEERKKITKCVPEVPKITIEDALELSPELRKYKEQYKDLFEIAEKIEGRKRHGSMHACFIKDTFVITDKGIVPIQNIQAGDLVLTHTNAHKKVLTTMINKSSDLYTIKTIGGFPITCTGSHPFYVKKRSNYTKERRYGDPKWVQAKDINKLDLVMMPINDKAIVPTWEELPTNNANFWWIIGRYLGDGWTEYYNRPTHKEYRIIICCAKNSGEIEDICSRLDGMFEYRVEENRTTAKIFIKITRKTKKISMDLYNFLQNFGRYANNKQIPEFVLNLPINLLKEFFEGYHGADGSTLSKDSTVHLTTVSKNMAIMLPRCIAKLYGRHCRLTITPSKIETIEGREVNSKEKYRISFTEDKRKCDRSHIIDSHICLSVSSISKFNKEEDVYNLTVEDDESYTANNVIVHNCGVVLSPEPLTNITALRYKEGSVGSVITHFDMDTLASMGLLKFDFLGLKTITVIHNAIQGLDIDIDAIPLDDPKVYKLLNSGKLLGVFQVEKDWAAKMIKQINPTNFDHITDIGALVRPGPLESGATKSYINRKSGLAPVEYVLPEIENILSPTYGVLVYQEQIMKIVQRLAGYSAGEADTFRKAIGKKIKEKLMIAIEDFVKRAVANGFDKDIIEKLGEDMAKHARYSFNKAHAASYGFITYQTAWLKTYYPVRFMSSLLSTEAADPEKVIEYVRDAQRMKINIVKPSINRSTERFIPDEEHNAIVYSLSSIRDVGYEAAKMIADRGPYESLKDFYDKVDRSKINKKTVIALISSGAMDCFNISRPELEEEYYRCRITDKFKDKDVVIVNTNDNSLEMEYKYLGIYLSGSPFDTYVNDDINIGGKDFYEISGQITEAKVFFTKNTNKKMAFIFVDTPSGFKRITVFPDIYEKHANNIKNGKIVTVTATIKDDDIIATKIINAKKK